MKRLLLFLAPAALAGCPGPQFPPDASPPDAAWLTYTGAYEDWDSTEADFHGVFGATVFDDAAAATTVQTAPNGRATLDVPPSAQSHVTFAEDPYLPATATVDPEVVALGEFKLIGIQLARAHTFFMNELGGLTYDPDTAFVEIEVRSDGATIALPGGPAGFHGDATTGWSAGATQGGGSAYVVFPNVSVLGTTSLVLTVTAPGGKTCHAPPTIAVAAGELDMTTVVCN